MYFWVKMEPHGKIRIKMARLCVSNTCTILMPITWKPDMAYFTLFLVTQDHSLWLTISLWPSLAIVQLNVFKTISFDSIR